jgi:hypothetical protein
MKKSLALLTIVALAQTGCGKGSSANNTSANKGATNTANAAAPAPAPATNTAAPAAAARVELKGTGLSVNGTEIAFGTPAADAMTRLQAGLGAPKTRTPRGDDCNGGMSESVEWSNGLTAFFATSGFVGWAIDKADNGRAELRLANGIGAGATRAEVEHAGVHIGDTSFGPGFQMNGVTASFGSEGATATLQDIFAGQTCAAG